MHFLFVDIVEVNITAVGSLLYQNYPEFLTTLRSKNET